MFETANNVRGLQVRKKELERIGSPMREIQHSTTGGKVEELHSLLLKSIETAKRAAIPIVSSASGSTLSSEKVIGMLCDGMLLASKLSVRAKLDDHSVMVANVDYRKAAKLIIRPHFEGCDQRNKGRNSRRAETHHCSISQRNTPEGPPLSP